MSISKVLITLATLAIVSTSFSSAAADSYIISTSLSHKSKPFATPTVIIERNSQGSIEVSGVYKLTLTVKEIANDIIKVDAILDSVHGEIAPSINVRLGQTANVTIGDIGFTLTVQQNIC